MAAQIEVDEMKGCLSYFDWMMRSVLGSTDDGSFLDKKDGDICGSSGKSKDSGDICARGSIVELCLVMFETDFIWDETIKEDEIRAKDAMELRRRYAAIVGADADKSERDIDRIWKSVHGKCSVLELILSICYRLDAMVNEDEPGSMVGMFFRILIGNMGFDLKKSANSEEDKSRQNGEIAQTKECADDRKAYFLAVINRFLKRNYEADGSGGGLFPLKKLSAEGGSKDQRTVSIWYQMGTWLNEHLDDEAHFRE